MIRTASKVAVSCAVIVVCVTGLAHAEQDSPCNVRGDTKAADWTSRCSVAIDAETDPKRRAELLFGRAYMAIERYEYDEALVDLNAAVTADPENPRALHERAYLHSELGNYSEAIADLDRQAKLQPDEPTVYRERAYARQFSGDLEGAYRDRAREFELDPLTASTLRARGEAAMWLGRFDEAARDFDKAEALATKAGQEEERADAAASRKELGLWRATARDKKAAGRCVMQNLDSKSPQLESLIGDCTQAFLAAKDKAAKSDALTTRASLWVLYDKGWSRATMDRRVAVGIDPGNAELYINLGYAFLATNHSWAANRQFERVLATERSYMALAGRAQARANLGDPNGAFADAKESFELKSNEPALWVLADLCYDKGEHEMARKFYLGVYQFGSRDDRLMARLKELGVEDPEAASRE